ncbi:MAG: hypothetical protein E6H53_08620 [Betaproteobacteria bacterium]|nr:MAG: hypothetical protein E6H53_08620 [Betaproteobacteria bacterium]
MSKPASMPFTPQQALEFMQKMWNPFGVPMAGVMPPVAPGVPPAVPFPNPMAMFATLDPAEIERKIGELRVIESWLAMSLNFMQMSIKTLELQKTSLEALRAGAAAASQPPAQAPSQQETKPHPHSQPHAKPHAKRPKPKENE